MARPMVDVFSVTVFPNSWPCEVYGDVFVFEENDSNTTHQLYKRSLEHADVIYEAGQGLLLTGLDIVLLIRKPVISILVKDRAHDNDVVAKGNVLLDSTTDNDYEQGKCSVVEGDCGHVRVNYIALACALVAEVHVGLWDFPKQTASQEDSKNSILASGTIVAHHAKTYARTTWDTRSTLLKVPSNQSIPVVFYAYNEPIINLTRKLLAVPAYASLIIEANTIEKVTNKQFFVGTAEFRAAQGRSHSSAYYNCDELQLLYICFENVFLSVRWREPFDLQYKYSPKEYLTPQPCFLSQVCEPGDCLLEVFSVFLGRKNDDDLSVSGTITVTYGTRSLTIFERDDNNPDRLVNGRKLLSISSPGFVDSHADFEIRVDLKDADDRLLIKNGSATFIKIAFADSEQADREYDRLMGAVILGERQLGYCVVHYANFDRAVRMEVKSILLCKGIGVGFANYYGRIVAWSGMFDYTSDYDKKYFRKVLFDMPEDNVEFIRRVASKKTKGSFPDEHIPKEVELSRSYIVMPICYPFFIDVDLYVSSHFGKGPIEHWQNTLQFQLYDKSPMKIQTENFDIIIHMESKDESDDDLPLGGPDEMSD